MSYWVHSGQSESLAFVSTYISQQQQVNFSGTWMLAAEWRDVPEYLGNTSIVNYNHTVIIEIFMLLFCIHQTNTYQGIVVTNGLMSFALFTYNCRRMLWSGGASIGVSADGRFFRNHNLSRALNAHHVACLNSPRSNWTNVLYQLCE